MILIVKTGSLLFVSTELTIPDLEMTITGQFADYKICQST